MPSSSPSARISSVQPLWAVEGGRVRIEGDGFRRAGDRLPEVRLGAAEARVVRASPRSLTILVPGGLPGGTTPLRLAGLPGETAFLEVGGVVTTGVHQVDSPAFDAEGNLYVTYSGTREQQGPVSIFRVRPDGVREPFVSGLTSPTALAVRGSGLYVSSRFEGHVYRVQPDGRPELFARDLGAPCGLAFGRDGDLYVGDRSGTIFRVDRAGSARAFATLPASVAAFHLAFGPDGCLYVTGPTLSPRDAVYRLDAAGRPEVVSQGFGRPQGLAFDERGRLYVVEALAGASGLYRLDSTGRSEQVLAAAGLVGVAFAPSGGLVVASTDTVYRLEVPLGGWRPPATNG
jgi:sugar lactone lactonase YvrE